MVANQDIRSSLETFTAKMKNVHADQKVWW
jgi:hypothetical protein